MSILRTVVAVAIAFACSLAHAQRSTPVQVLHPSGAAGDRFGSSVAVDGDTMIVGAPLDDVGANANQGSAHVYRWTGAGWTLEATLNATGGAANDEFGISVAISGDTVIVGAWNDDIGANVNQGSAYVFTRTGSSWTQQAQLTATGGAGGDNFGISVAISGDTAIVGAYADDVGANTDQGSAYVFMRTGLTWTQQAQLNATGGGANDLFGVSVAISGDTAIVGASADDVGANANQGSAYAFMRTGSTWTQQAQLNATGGAANDNFGISVAISADTVIVGAWSDDVGANADQGSAYVFTRTGSTWTQQAQLNATGGRGGANFGGSVAISGDTAIVGAYFDSVGFSQQGSAHIFTRTGSTWAQQAQLTAPDATGIDLFGNSVAISGDTAIVGAYVDDVGFNVDQGSAWVFARVGNRWIGPDMMLSTSFASTDDRFGRAVAISGDTAVIGVPEDNVGANIDQGSVYVFVRSGLIWTQQAQLFATGGAAGDYFGISVAIQEDTIVVGASLDDVGANADQGSAYVFVRSGTSWAQQAQLNGAAGAASDRFGISVAIDASTVVVGANDDDVGANANQGSAFVFTRSGVAWTQQAQLTSTGGAASDNFGIDVAIEGDLAVIGADGDDVGANADQGSVYTFVRSAGSWSQQAQLNVFGGLATDALGVSVAISGDTIVAGANSDDVGVNVNQGAAYVFTFSGTTWQQQAQLIAASGAPGDGFGRAVAIAGDAVIVGGENADIGTRANQGSASFFTRAGTRWREQTQTVAADGSGADNFGISVGLSGDTAIAGAWLDDIGFNTNQGSAWIFSLPAADFARAHNDGDDLSYATISAGLLAASSGEQLTVTEAAWRTASSVDTAGKSIAFVGNDDIRTPPQSVITLGGSSSLTAPSGAVIEINGQLRINDYGDLYADTFRLGSRGIMTARTNASLSINAPT
ncbi:MAG: FG-GAP repeat protein, partial [Phycisphaerae bacterium]